MSWTDERIELLKTLWASGQSASQIAKELGGVTRNAVIGKVHRLGLSNRTGGSDAAGKSGVAPQPKAAPQTAKVEAPAPEAKPKAPPKPAAPAPKPPMAKPILPAERNLPPQPSASEISAEALASYREVEKRALRLGLMELTERTCKWPFGDPATEDFWFCGLPVEPGSAYCKPCADVAYQPASSRRNRRK